MTETFCKFPRAVWEYIMAQPEKVRRDMFEAVTAYLFQGELPEEPKPATRAMMQTFTPMLDRMNRSRGAPQGNKNALKKQFRNNSETIQESGNLTRTAQTMPLPEEINITDNQQVRELEQQKSDFSGENSQKSSNSAYREEKKEKRKRKFSPTPPYKEKEINKEKEESVYTLAFSKTDKTDYDKFLIWTWENFPYVSRHLNAPTETEFRYIVETFGKNALFDTVRRIENRADLRCRYVELGVTIINWLQNGNDSKRH